MKVVRILISTVIAALFAWMAAPAAFADTPSPAPSPSSAQNVDQLTQQLQQDQAQLDQLTNQVEGAQGKLDLLNRRVAEDQAKQKQLADQLTEMARMQYEVPTLGITTILQARSLDQLLTEIAQSRLVAAKQHDLLEQQKQLKANDDAARADVAKQVAQLSTARDAAAKLAADAQQMLASAKAEQAAEAAAAQKLQQQAQAAMNAAAPTVTMPASSQSGGTNPNRFAFGNCTWYVASLVYIPWLGNAIDWWPNARAYGYAEGSAPQVGAIMVSAESGYGHVSLVTAVNGDGSWTVTEMNYSGFDVVDTRTVTPGTVPLVGFIYGAH